MSGFRENEFIERFEESGGKWLYFSAEPYHSYDGSHLNKQSALILSHDLAKKILNYL
jgi:hypothetical protein